MRKKREKVQQSDREAADFLSEYRALCEKYMAMVIVVDSDGYQRFAVGFIDHPGPLDKAVSEMLIGRTVMIAWPDHEE